MGYFHFNYSLFDQILYCTNSRTLNLKLNLGNLMIIGRHLLPVCFLPSRWDLFMLLTDIFSCIYFSKITIITLSVFFSCFFILTKTLSSAPPLALMCYQDHKTSPQFLEISHLMSLDTTLLVLFPDLHKSGDQTDHAFSV